MIRVYLLLSVLIISASDIEAARILGVFPSSSISHQSVFRTLTQELAKRGHDVVVITANPAFPKGESPKNLTEINVREASIALKKQVVESARGNNNDIFTQVKLLVKLFSLVVEAMLNTNEVKELLTDKTQKFDLLVIEACYRPALVFSHFYQAPVILISSFGTMEQFIYSTGAALHPILYPTTIHQRLNNLSLLEKLIEIIKHYVFESLIAAQEYEDDKMLKNKFGEHVPPLRELKKKVDLIFIDVHKIWDNNRPVPPNIIYLGSLHIANKQETKLPKDLDDFMNGTHNGVIYMSLGTNTSPSILSQNKIETFLRVFSKLPYDVLMKWDEDELSGLPANVKIFKWLPQSDLLRHPNIKLFITQGGLQSTGEAIAAGVPMIGMPMLGDQWYNVEQYQRHNIGLRVDIETMTENKLMEAIQTITNNISFKTNIIALRNQLHDQPQTSLERAVWWTEYVIRHKGGKHLQASGANVSWTEYYEIQLCAIIFLGLSLVMIILGTLMYVVAKFLKRVWVKQIKFILILVVLQMYYPKFKEWYIQLYSLSK